MLGLKSRHNRPLRRRRLCNGRAWGDIEGEIGMLEQLVEAILANVKIL